MRALVIVLAVGLLGGAAHAADPKCFANPERWSYDRSKEALQQAGERFIADMEACDPTFASTILEVARYQLHDDELKKFNHQSGFVLWAYGIAWGLLAVSGLLLWLRQQRLTAEIAALEARIRAEGQRT
jgi:hypothetical protein